jgi:hypothetical protein
MISLTQSQIVRSLCLLLLLILAFHSVSCAADDQAVKQLAERTLVLLQRDEKLRAERKALDRKIDQILEKERIAANTARDAAAENNDGDKEGAIAANLRWQEVRIEMKTRLKELEPTIADLLAAEKALNEEKAALQTDALEASKRLPAKKQNRKLAN